MNDRNIISTVLMFVFAVHCLSSHAVSAINIHSNATTIFAQDSIIFEGNLLNPSYMLGIRNISIKEVYSILSEDADCKVKCDQTRLLTSISSVFSLFGGYYLGYGITNLLLGKEDSNRSLMLGGAFLALGLGFGTWSQCHLEKTINIYNEKQSRPSFDSELSMNVGFTPSGGLGMTLYF